MMLAERSGKQQQQQQLSQKVPTGQTVKACEKGALREQRISGVLAPLSSFQSLPLAFVALSERPCCCLSAATIISSSSSARKRQWTRGKQVQLTSVRGRRWRQTAPITSPGPTRRCLPPRPCIPPPSDAPADVAAQHRPPRGRSKPHHRLREPLAHSRDHAAATAPARPLD
jgi:hypothetical protein